MIVKWVYPEIGRPPKSTSLFTVSSFSLLNWLFFGTSTSFSDRKIQEIRCLYRTCRCLGVTSDPSQGRKVTRRWRRSPWNLGTLEGVDKISKNWGWWWYVGGSKFHRWWLWDYDVICSMFSIWYSRSYSDNFHCCLFLPVMFLPAALFSRALEASEVFNEKNMKSSTHKRPANLSWIYSRLEGPVFVYRLFMTISYDVGDIILYLPLSGCLNYVNPPIGLRVQPLSTMNLAIYGCPGSWKSFAAVASQAVSGLGQPTGAVENPWGTPQESPMMGTRGFWLPGYPHNVACWSIPHLVWWLSQL